MKRILFLLILFPVFSQTLFAENAKSPVEEIILVFKTHFDIGYTKLASEVVEQYRTTMIDKALDVVDASEVLPEKQKFIWTIPGWPLAKILENQDPKRAERLEQAILQGRFTVHALPFTTHTETLVEEDLVRGLRFSELVAKRFSLPSSTAGKMTDVTSHSWFLPTLLAHAGVKFMHEGTNSGCADPVVPLLYFREGPDGSRVLTMHVNGYGTGIDPPEGWPYRTWLGLAHTGDNQGPPKPQDVEALFQEVGKKYPNVKIRIGKLEDFGNAILEKENLDTIPVVRGDMPDSWIHGPMCDPQGQKLARAVHERLAHQEILQTLVAIHKGRSFDPEQTKRIAGAWEQSLLYGEHTWGAALDWMIHDSQGETLPFGDAWTKFWEAKNFNESQKRAMLSWEEHSDYIRRAASMLPDAKADENVFNPLPWDLKNYSGETIVAGGVGKSQNASPIKTTECDPEKDVVVESPWYRMTVTAKTGQIKSLRDLKNNRELIASESKVSMGFLYQRASAEMCDKFLTDYSIADFNWVLSQVGKQGVPRDVPERRIVPDNVASMQIHTTEGKRTLVIHYQNNTTLPFESLALDITFYDHRPEIRFDFQGKAKRPDAWPEAGYFCFPLNIETPQFRLGRLGGIVDPVTQIIPGSNQHMQWLRTGAAVFGNDGYGVGVCPLDAPLVSLDEPGCWLYSKDFVPQNANLCFNLFNNQWTTNFRLWNEGDISASFVLWTFEKYDNETALVTPSLETLTLNNPTTVSPNVLPEGTKGISLNRKGIYVTAFGPDPDSNDLMLRMWEMVGKGKSNPEVVVRFPEELIVKEAVPCDLLGRPIADAIPVIDHCLKVNVGPYQPVNLKIIKADSRKTLLFLIDEGLGRNEVTTVYGNDYAAMDQSLSRILDGLKPLEEKYRLAFLVYPTWHYSPDGFDGKNPDDAANRVSPNLHHLFDFFSAKKKPLYLEIYSSGIRTSQNGEIGSQVTPHLHYGQGHAVPGISMDMECLAMLKKRYGDTFEGVRFHELIGTHDIGLRDQEAGKLDASHGFMVSFPALQGIFETVRATGLKLVWGDHSWNLCYHPDGSIVSDVHALWDEQLNKAIDIIGAENITLNWSNNGWPLHQYIVNDFFKKNYRGTHFGMSVQSWYWSEVDASTTVVKSDGRQNAWIKWYSYGDNDMPAELVASFTQRAFEAGGELVQYEHPQYFFNYYAFIGNALSRYTGYYDELPDYSVKLRTKRLIQYLLNTDAENFPSTKTTDYYDANVHQFNGYKENSGAKRYFQNTLGVVGVNESRYFDKYNNDLSRWFENSKNRFVNSRFADSVAGIMRANTNYNASDEILLLRTQPNGVTAEFYHYAGGLILKNSEAFLDNPAGHVVSVIPLNLFSEYVTSVEGDPDDYLVLRDNGTTFTPEIYKVQTKGNGRDQTFDLIKADEPALLSQVVPRNIPRDGFIGAVPLRTRNALTGDCLRPKEQRFATVHKNSGKFTITAFTEDGAIEQEIMAPGTVVAAASVDVDGDFKDEIALLIDESGNSKITFYKIDKGIEPMSEQINVGKFKGRLLYSGRICTYFKAY